MDARMRALRREENKLLNALNAHEQVHWRIDMRAPPRTAHFLPGHPLSAVRCGPQERREAIVEIESTLGQQRGSGLSIARQVGGSGASSRASLRGQ